ncbi:MAG: FAD-dependent oxidoreductase [Acetobacteraceae bacterium]
MRSWGALRIMTPDGLPIYQRSATCPGAWLVTVHSGVTLAPLHARILAQAVHDDLLPESLVPFSPLRFTAPVAA